MADTNVQPESVPALALELETLHERVRKMDALLGGAESILSTIRYDGELCFTPANEERTDRHRRAYNLIEFLGEQIEAWKQTEADLDSASDDVWDLMRQAKDGRLVRHERQSRLEPVA